VFAARLNVTVNVSEAVLVPSVAITGTGPNDDSGTVKLAKKNQLVVVITEAGVVGILLPLNVIVTAELGSNPAPEIFSPHPGRKHTDKMNLRNDNME
jgi:hypothetical protein